jgi:hypothetical protein
MRSSTIPATPFVYDFVEKNGHTYHRLKEGSKYPAPDIFEGLNSIDLTYRIPVA